MFGCGIRDDDGVFLTCIYICEKEMCGSESGCSDLYSSNIKSYYKV